MEVDQTINDIVRKFETRLKEKVIDFIMKEYKIILLVDFDIEEQHKKNLLNILSSTIPKRQVDEEVIEKKTELKK